MGGEVVWSVGIASKAGKVARSRWISSVTLIVLNCSRRAVCCLSSCARCRSLVWAVAMDAGSENEVEGREVMIWLRMQGLWRVGLHMSQDSQNA